MRDHDQPIARLWPTLVQGFRDLELTLASLERALILLLILGLIGLGIYAALSPLLPPFARLDIADYAGLVLMWLVMVGSARAAASAKVPSKSGVGVIVLLAAAVAAALLAWAALRLWLLDFQLGSTWVPGVSGSLALAAIPAGFALMAGRFLARALVTLFPVPGLPSS